MRGPDGKDPCEERDRSGSLKAVMGLEGPAGFWGSSAPVVVDGIFIVF